MLLLTRYHHMPCFNSRTCEGATFHSRQLSIHLLVSIHAPVKVRPDINQWVYSTDMVSIHAPVKVRRYNRGNIRKHFSFNSRTCEGATRYAKQLNKLKICFNSRTCEGATAEGDMR